ncbi:unnamed protein product [Rhizophagus irregularis]|nr:unnamed protein product [Rhizophagus irregularis]
MASFFEAEVYFASVSVGNSGILRNSSLADFLDFLKRFLDASWNIDSKKQNLRSFVEIEPTGTMPKLLTTDFVRHWILNTEFLLQYSAAHVIPALRSGVLFLEQILNLA